MVFAFTAFIVFINDFTPYYGSSQRSAFALFTITLRLLMVDFTFVLASMVDCSATVRGTTNVEGPHGQLRTGLTDGLRRNHTNGFAHIHGCTAGQVTAITFGADTILVSQVSTERILTSVNTSGFRSRLATSASSSRCTALQQ